MSNPEPDTGLTEFVGCYIAEGLHRDLDDPVIEKTKHHLVDTIAAMLTGSQLHPGRLAEGYVSARGGVAEATVAGSGLRTSTELATLANAAFAHADESDDSHEPSRTHPGCAVVPAALAVAEARERSGLELLRAVNLGYDVCCSLNRALWEPGPVLRSSVQSTHMTGSLFGALAASAALAGLDTDQARQALSYGAQHVSGLTTWLRDSEHVEKAFDFAGIPARNGVTAVEMVDHGLTGVTDVLDGSPSLFEARGQQGHPARLREELGVIPQIMTANIKLFSVGSPIQAPGQALTELLAENDIRADDVERVVCTMPTFYASIVDDRAMPDISLQYVMAVGLLDGAVTFQNTHDEDRIQDATVRQLMARVDLVRSDEMEAKRQAHLELVLRDGNRLDRHVFPVRGTKDDPMERSEVDAKVTELLSGVLDDGRARELLDTAWSVETLRSVRELAPLLKL